MDMEKLLMDYLVANMANDLLFDQLDEARTEDERNQVFHAIENSYQARTQAWKRVRAAVQTREEARKDGPRKGGGAA